MVKCGDHLLDTADTNEQSRAITEIINHPDYDARSSKNDIALLKVSGSFTCSQGKIWPACLPNKNVRISLTLQLTLTHDIILRNWHMKAGKTPL